MFHMIEHVGYMRWLDVYLKETQDKGIIFKSYNYQHIKTIINTNIPGNWDTDIFR